MSTVKARRTLVKSPPELWAELSDEDALRRRLEPLGEIRITRREPESTVAWEGERARGTVEIEASGWGTRVTLTAEPNMPDPPPPADREPVTPEHAPREAPPTVAAPEHDVRPSPPHRTLRPGWPPSPRMWSRLMPWRGQPSGHEPPPLTPVPPPAEPAAPAVPQPPPPAPEPEPARIPRPAPPLEPAATGPEAGAGDLDAVLTGVLDDLGSAHHRPFSRG
jgi:hypothetical protein